MERWAENTLRTLGIVVTAIFVIFGCLVLLLLALCFGALGSYGHPGQTDPQAQVFVVGAILAAGVLIAMGIFVISMLARSMVRDATSQQPPYPLVPPGTVLAPKQPDPTTAAQPATDQAKLDQALARYEAMAARREPPPKTEPVPAMPARIPTGEIAASHPVDARPIDVRHLSPASRSAIRQLAYAIVAKIAAEVALGIVGWNGALGYGAGRGAYRVPFPVYRFGFMAWGLAAIAPHIVLLYALARKPGPRAFAYSLVIPTLHILFGLFGHSAFLAFILRSGQIAAPLLSNIPWILDLLIFYLAWKAIRLTGIFPNPARLIVASAVIVLYSSLLPVLVAVLNYSQH